MPHYKLIYFDIRGRGESIRMMFRYAGVPFEDCRIRSEDWPALKPKTPYGVLPILEVDGQQLCQTNAINRYVAKQFGLTGKNDWEAAQCDEIGDALNDMFGFFRFWRSQTDPKLLVGTPEHADKTKALRDTLDNDYIKPLLAKLENRVKTTASGYLVSDQLTWADLAVFDQLVFYEEEKPHFLEPHPELYKFMQKIREHPKLKEYIANRSTGPK